MTFKNTLFSAVTSRGRVKGVETVVEATADKKKRKDLVGKGPLNDFQGSTKKR